MEASIDHRVDDAYDDDEDPAIARQQL